MIDNNKLNHIENIKKSITNPLYSICICNYNMAHTISSSLGSLLPQLDERFEVIIVDDGSSDNSVDVIQLFAKEYSALRLIKLERDANRKLGFTRNISIKQARGSYVLLHLDCDDIFGPYIQDFVEVFQRIEVAAGRDILLSGQHVNMAKRDFLLEFGPYINIYRGEDRDLWSRMAKIDAYIPFDHIDFIERIPKSASLKYPKMVKDTIDHMKNDFRSGVTFPKYVWYEFRKSRERTLKYQVFRYLMLLPSWILSWAEPSISQIGRVGSPEEFAEYREKNRGTYAELMIRFGADPSISFLRPDAQYIFSEKPIKKPT